METTPSLSIAKSLTTSLLLLMFPFLLFGTTLKTPGKKTGYMEIQAASAKNHESLQAKSQEKIKIGLLVSVHPEKDLLAKSAVQGAVLAIEQANKIGGYNGSLFELVVRTADGLWGAGSKESVKFVHEDEVLAIVTAVDGRNAHLAEQVAAKSHVVQVATRATEETLSQAYVPWFFRIVPNDRQQGLALIDHVFEKNSFSKVHLLIEDGYDHSSGANTFKKLVKKKGYRISGETVFSNSGSGDLKVKLKSDTEALIAFGSFGTAKPFLDDIRKDYPSLQVFGSLAMTVDGLIGSEYTEGCESGIFVSSKFCFTTPGQKFKDAYRENYQRMPNPAASYAYDGVNLIVEAIKKAGHDREKIREVLKEIKYTEAVTGPIQFDENGNRISPVFMIRIIKGHPVILNP